MFLLLFKSKKKLKLSIYYFSQETVRKKFPILNDSN